VVFVPGTLALLGVFVLAEAFITLFDRQTGIYSAILSGVGKDLRDEYANFVFSEGKYHFNRKSVKVALLRVIGDDPLGDRRMNFDLSAILPVLNEHVAEYEEPLQPFAGFIVFCSGEVGVVRQAVTRYSNDVATLNSFRGRAELAAQKCPERFQAVALDLISLDKTLRHRYGADYLY
jgi:hypothetical protein